MTTADIGLGVLSCFCSCLIVITCGSELVKIGNNKFVGLRHQYFWDRGVERRLGRPSPTRSLTYTCLRAHRESRSRAIIYIYIVRLLQQMGAKMPSATYPTLCGVGGHRRIDSTTNDRNLLSTCSGRALVHVLAFRCGIHKGLQ